jgi:(p)ppGpp synthase/HD superfamily hydrolase
MNHTEANLECAIALAVEAHSGQTDKAGEPYILHPLRVMFSLDSEQERICAILHDVVEDSAVTFEDLEQRGFSAEIIDALRALTKLPEESGADEGYRSFVERAASNPIARKVKMADLEDNLNVLRLETFGEKDAQRVARYLRAMHYLRAQSAD